MTVMCRGCIFCFQQCIIVGGIQAIILYNLWITLPKVIETEFCIKQLHTDMLVICVICIFIISMIPSIFEITNELCIVATTRIYFRYEPNDGQAIIKKFKRTSSGVFVASCIVIYQILLWLSTFIIGILYIITSEGVTNIVQAAVAITFLMELDNLCLFMYGKESELVHTGRYRTDELFYKFPIEFIPNDQQKWLNNNTILPLILVIIDILIMNFIYWKLCSSSDMGFISDI